MSRASLRIPAYLRTGFSLALSASLLVGSSFAETPKGSPGAAATGNLSVTTDPADAAVYVDGHLAGQTPARVSALTAGEHRVRIVKDGYLENSRVVTVPAGAPTTLTVKLTRSTSTTAATAPEEQVSTQGGGGGGKKWVIIGAAAAAAVVAGVVLSKKNEPPTPGTISVAPSGTGMAGITQFTFTSQGASDPDGDSLTKSWTFSDGGSGTGDSVTHTFNNQGAATANLSIDDGHSHKVSAPQQSITIGPPVSGTWTGGVEPGFNCPFSLTLTQSGTTIGGSLNWVGTCTGTFGLASGSISGTTHPTTVNLLTNSFTVNGVPSPTFNERLQNFSTDSTGTTMTGTITTSASNGASISASTTLRRQ